MSFGSILSLRKLLSTIYVTIDSRIIQKACDRKTTNQLVCLLEHCSRDSVPLREITKEVITVHSERAFDILRTYDILAEHIIIDWNREMLSSVMKDDDQFHGVSLLNLVKYFGHSSRFILQETGEFERCSITKSSNLANLLFASIYLCDPNVDDQGNGCKHLIKCILPLNKDMINIQNGEGQTPIMYAACLKKKEIVRLLAEEKPDISIQSKDGKLLINFINDWDDIIHILMKVIQVMVH